MPMFSGIYDGGVIAPVAKIKENLSIYSLGRYTHYRIDFIEPMPWSSQMVVEMVVASGATTIAANGTIAQRLPAILTLNDNNLLHLRWQPLDDVEGVLWEQASVARYATRGVHSRVDLSTTTKDPYLSTTTFFILGKDRDMNLEVRNPRPVAQALARFVFFGFRYVLMPWKDEEKGQEVIKGIVEGRIPSTWLPAEGYAIS